MLRARGIRIAAFVLWTALSFWAGGYLAIRSFHSRFVKPTVHAETARNLDIALNLAAMVRLGEEERAMHLLDLLIDSWAASLARSAPWDEIEPDRQQMLLLARKYRSAFPVETPNPDRHPEELYGAIPEVAEVPGENLRPLRRLLDEAAAAGGPGRPPQSAGGS